MDQVEVDAVRLCRCRQGETVDSASAAQRGSIVLGTIIEARWDPINNRRLGILYSSGVFQLWDVVDDVRAEFMLCIPVGGLPGLPASNSGAVSDRKAAASMTHFDFIPLNASSMMPNEADACRIAFSTQRSRRLFVADVPTVGAPTWLTDRYLSGSRMYECLPALDAEVTVVRAWLAAGTPTDVSCIVAGCSSGSLHVWAVGAALNPDAMGAGGVVASPRMARVASFTGGGKAESVNAPVPLLPPSPSCSLSAHEGRVRAVQPLCHTGGGGGGPALARASNVFATAGDDGRVRLWSVRYTPTPTPSLSGPVYLSVVRAGELPSEGIPCHALAALDWPWEYTTRAPPFPSPQALSSRFLLCTGSVEGCVRAWEVVCPPALTDMACGGEEEGDCTPSFRLASLASSRSLDPITALSLSPPSPGTLGTTQTGPPSARTILLAVACADASLALYRLDGAVLPTPTPMSAGGTQPVCLTLHGAVGRGGGGLTLGMADNAGDGGQARDEAGTRSSALSARAMGRFHAAFVCASFNISCGVSSMVDGALLACTGGGEVQLWSKSCLPGDEEYMRGVGEEREGEGGKVGGQEREGVKEARPPRPPRPSIQPVAERLGSPPPITARLGEEETEPEPHARSEHAVETLPRPVSPPPAPRVLSSTASSRARLVGLGDTIRALREAQGQGRGGDRSRSRSPARVYLRTAAASAVRSAYGPTGRRSPSTDRCAPSLTPVERARARVEGAADRSAGPPPARRPAAPAIPPIHERDMGEGEGGVGIGLNASWTHAKGLGRGALSAPTGVEEDVNGGCASANVSGTGRGMSGDATRDPGALESTRSTQRTGVGRGPVGTLLADLTGRIYPEEEEEDEGPPPLPRPSLSHRTAGPFLHPRFRSPARLAAALAADAALNVRAAAMLTKEGAGAGDAVIDEHPSAILLFRRAVHGLARPGEGGPPGGEPSPSHLLAPSMGSTANLALEIERLEACTFDETAALASILADRRISDVRVRGSLMARARARAGAALPCTGQVRGRPERVLDVPAHGTLYPGPLPPPAPAHEAEQRRSRSRSKSLLPALACAAARAEENVLLREEREGGGVGPAAGSPGVYGRRHGQRKVSIPRPRPGDSVSAADVLAWRAGLRAGAGGRQAQGAYNPRPAHTQTAAQEASEDGDGEGALDVSASSGVGAGMRAGAGGQYTYAHGHTGDVVASIQYNPTVRSTGMGSGGVGAFAAYAGSGPGLSILRH